jgi:death-on-curing protein
MTPEPPAFLSVRQVLAIHERMIAAFGGNGGIRDHGLLESAVTMPAASFGGEYLHRDVPEMAAAYLFHICRAHAFVDGNKRTALAASEVFLIANGWRLSASDDALVTLTLAVASRGASKDEVVSFFREHTRRTRTR